MAKNRSNTALKLIILGIVLFVLCLLSIFLGSAKLQPADFFKGLFDIERKTSFGVIIYSLRFPRMLSCLLAGFGLGISGALLQSVTGNKMASPNLIGVSSGGGFFVILTLFFFPKLFDFLPLFCLLGAFLATVFIVMLSGKIGLTSSGIILVGLAFSAVLSACISLISLIDSDVLVSYNAFSIGSLSGVRIQELIMPLFMIAAAFVMSMAMSSKLDILFMGDNVAQSLGVNAKKVRIVSMLASSLSAAAAVSFAGLLGFVGLMAPHIARSFFKENMRLLLPSSALMGAVLVTGADLVGRTFFSPSEVPVGIIMALLGAPFFLFLLLFKGGTHNA